MANDEDKQHAQTDELGLDLNTTDSSSDDGGSGDDEDESPTVEWLATGRERRSTAGNRMKSMIAAEEPDDDLELLFAEDEDDAGFTDVGDDGSDVQMDSSSDEEDAQENADELEGEKELEKQARENRQASRKRKAQEAIPIKFRKKVKIAPTPSGSSTAPEPKPRPKKKSERISWLPSPADMPTRASKRETTMLSKEQLHQQMIEREVKRLKQVEAMEKKAKRMEALKKPPMTQAQRLAEAAVVEKKNSKSLNRWEEAEKQREEERKAKLAALNNRTLDGPVVTFWSGVGEWVDGKLKHVGKIVTIEEKPVKKKRNSAAGQDLVTDTDNPDKTQESAQTTNNPEKDDSEPALNKPVEQKEDTPKDGVTSAPIAPAPKDITVEGEKTVSTANTATPLPQPTQSVAAGTPSAVSDPTQKDSIPPPTPPPPPAPTALSLPQPQPQIQPPKPLETKPQEVKPPEMRPPATSVYTTSMFAPPQASPLMKPPELKPPSNSFLAPPAGVNQSGLSMPMIGYHSTPNMNSSSNVLAPPNTTQRQSPLSMPQTGVCHPPISIPTHPMQPPTQSVSTPAPKSNPIPTVTPKPAPTQTPAPVHTQKSTQHVRYTLKTPLTATKPSKANAQRHQPKETPPPPPPSPPANGKATRNCIILQNFNENAVKEKAVQNQILFGKDMAKLGKPPAAPRCVITHHPARYKDPKTGLPYYNAYAYREIQKLGRGEYKWSRLVGAWMGSGSNAASGVPARFLDPDAPGPPKKTDTAEAPKEDVAPATPAVPAEQKEQVVTTSAAPAVVATSDPLNPSNPPNPTSTKAFAPIPASAPVSDQIPTTIPAPAEASVISSSVAPAIVPVPIASPAVPVSSTTVIPTVPTSAVAPTAVTAGDQIHNGT
ncbi:YL1-domain-containing protein [Annulohypoxylon maeteangense]|uniref:YL1-domain-containing protein n=1 Tax=Annulohypoxylon maeteangense TaxID=1927788 RepID=UPI002008AFC3|nr:YL1-domain-containing protein [Annulohypoxylon maeteangense]KAI0887415.1 YL1-domain-containing protein [Annulohypoxylon maeteangense]